MSCDFCMNESSIKELESKYSAHFCPACGESLMVSKALITLRKKCIENLLKQTEETVEIDGEKLIYDRTPLSPIKLEDDDPRIRPYDPDNVDISKELAMLKKHNEKEKAKQEELKVAFSESLQRAIIRKKLHDYCEYLFGYDFDI